MAGCGDFDKLWDYDFYDRTPLDSEFEAGWGQKRSPTSEGSSAMAAAATVVEAVPPVRSRRRYRKRRDPRAALLRCCS